MNSVPRYLGETNHRALNFVGLGISWILSILLGCFLSLIGCIWLLQNICTLKVKSYSIKIICHIVILNSFSTALSLIYYTLPYLNDFFVRWLYITSTISNLLSFIWTTALSYHSYGLMTRLTKFNQEKFYKQSLLFIYTCFLLVVVVDIVLRELHIFDDIQIHSAIYLGIILFCVLFSLFLYLKQKYFVQQYFTKELLEQFNINIGKLTLYPIAQIIIFSPAIIGLFIGVVQLQEYTDVIVVLLAIQSYQGFLQALLYKLVRNTAISDIKFQSIEGEQQTKETQILLVQDLNTDKLLREALID